MPPPDPPQGSTPTHAHFVPLVVWLGLQLMALIAGAADIPLADQFPRPAERMTMAELLVVQVWGSAMLLPIMFRSVADGILAAVAILPFIQIASFLSAVDVYRSLLLCLYVGAWLLLLGFIHSLVSCSATLTRWAALLTALSLTGPLCAYLKHDFVTGRDWPWPPGTLGGPITGALSLLYGDSDFLRIWLPLLGALLLVGSWKLRRCFAQARK